MDTCETCRDDACAYQGTPSPQCDDYTGAPIDDPPAPPTPDDYETLLAERDDLAHRIALLSEELAVYRQAIARVRDVVNVEVRR